MKLRIRTGATLALASLLGMGSIAAIADSSLWLDRPINPGGTVSETWLLSRHDTDFLNQAYQGSMGEVRLARLAEERATSDSVKRLARRLIDDHTKVENRLSDFARDHRHSLPTNVHWKHEAELRKASDLRGADFDRAFLDHMEMCHEKSIKMYREARHYGSHPAISRFAGRMLPILQDHLTMIRDLRAGK